MGSTQKSFTWLPTSSSNLSLYWFRRRGAKWFFFFILFSLVVFYSFDFSHFTPFENTQVIRALCYVLWRAVDCVFFFVVHFFIFFFAALTWGFHYLTNFASVRYWATATNDTDTAPSVLAPHDQTDNLRMTDQPNYSCSLVSPSLTTSDSRVTDTSTIDLVGALYRLLLVTSPVSGLPRTVTVASSLKPLSKKTPTLALHQTTTHSSFFLQTILPYSTSLGERSVCFLELNSLNGFYSGFLSPNTVNFGYATQGTATRTVRWLFRNVSSVSKDTSYIRNLMSGASNKNLLTSLTGQVNSSSSATAASALEWFGFRSAYLVRPFLIDPLVMDTHENQQNTSLTTLPCTEWVNPVINSQQNRFMWNYWSSFFTNNDYLILNLATNENLKKIDSCYHPNRRWL